jgi:hypothetical protein
MTKGLPFIVIFGLILLVTCDSDKPTEPGTETYDDVIMPLKVGNCWEGIAYYGDFSSRTWQKRDIFISGQEVINEEIWYQIRVIYNETDTTPVYGLYTNRPDGLWSRSVDTAGHYGEPYLLYKYPGQIGDEYYIGSGLYRIEDTSHIIELSGVKYECYVYLSFDSSHGEGYEIRTEFCALGTGKVYQKSLDSSDPPGIFCYIWELERFTEGD